MQLQIFNLKWARISFAVALLLTFVACGVNRPTVTPPRGRGWFLYGQGFKQKRSSVSVSIRSDGAGNTITTTTTKHSKGYVNASARKQLQADHIRPSLAVGSNVADHDFGSKAGRRGKRHE